EPRAQESREDRPLPDGDDVVGWESLAPRLTVTEPESDDDRQRHQDSVPANHEGADLEGDGARRVHVRLRISRALRADAILWRDGAPARRVSRHRRRPQSRSLPGRD